MRGTELVETHKLPTIGRSIEIYRERAPGGHHGQTRWHWKLISYGAVIAESPGRGYLSKAAVKGCLTSVGYALSEGVTL